MKHIKKGLTKDIIIDAALAQIEENGLSAFSLRGLADLLEIKVSFLYNHVRSQKDLLAEVGVRAVGMLTGLEENAIINKQRDEALFAPTGACRLFAREHTELYRIIMKVHSLDIPILESAAEKTAKPVLRVISDYGIEKDMQIHYQLMLCSVMHVFFTHEYNGGFSLSAAGGDGSGHFCIGCIAARLNSD